MQMIEKLRWGVDWIVNYSGVVWDSPRAKEALLFSSQNWAAACDCQQCGSLRSVDSDEPVQPPVKLRSKLQIMFS